MYKYYKVFYTNNLIIFIGVWYLCTANVKKCKQLEFFCLISLDSVIPEDSPDQSNENKSKRKSFCRCVQ
jgi:hypothetical protein